LFIRLQECEGLPEILDGIVNVAEVELADCILCPLLGICDCLVVGLVLLKGGLGLRRASGNWLGGRRLMTVVDLRLVRRLLMIGLGVGIGYWRVQCGRLHGVGGL
jgi:hypothetical protein